jgi:hypothetical protein
MDHDVENRTGERGLEGRYANYFEVGHNQAEFIIDFGQFYRQGNAPTFHTRIVTGPVYAKALTRLLSEAIARHEESFGLIDEP